MPKILIERDGPVTVIVMNRPEVRNALDNEAIGLLGEAFQAFDCDEEARVAVLTGAEGAFCAGADLKEMSHEANYEACAGGLGVALYCDLRIADETAVFGVFSCRWGVPMSDGTTVRLPRLVGMSNALDMLLTGRAIGADEAKHMGLANYVVPKGQARAEAIALAKKMAEFPQIAMRSDRNSTYTQLGLPLDDAVLEEARLAQAAKEMEAQSGAARFAAGAGRHGAFEEE